MGELTGVVPSFHRWPMMVQVSITRLDGREFKVMVGNGEKKEISKKTVEINGGEDQGFIVSGLTRRVFECLKGPSIALSCFYFLSLDSESYPIMKVTIGSTSHVSDLTVFLHHYDIF
jgi:hypothetical protein